MASSLLIVGTGVYADTLHAMIFPEFDSVALQLGPLAIRWYGLMYLLGFLAAWWLGRIRARRPDSVVSEQQLDDLLFYCALGVIFGGRIGYILFYDFAQWLNDPMVLLRIWEGGMSFHGGFLGVSLAVILFSRKYKLPLFGVADFIAPLTPIGLFTGRIGNFINGELWGAPSSLPWAMKVPCENHYNLCVEKLDIPLGTAIYTPPLHPNQLYEAGLEGLLLFVILWWYSSKPRPAPSVAGLFLVGYGAFRFLIEFVRIPDSHIGYLAFDWFTMGQLLSLPMVLAGAFMIWLAFRKEQKQ